MDVGGWFSILVVLWMSSVFVSYNLGYLSGDKDCKIEKYEERLHLKKE